MPTSFDGINPFNPPGGIEQDDRTPLSPISKALDMDTSPARQIEMMLRSSVSGEEEAQPPEPPQPPQPAQVGSAATPDSPVTVASEESNFRAKSPNEVAQSGLSRTLLAISNYI